MAMKACFIYTELDEKKMRNKFDIEPQLERTLNGRGAFSPTNSRVL
jgi:hypothetical protein